MTEQTAFEAFAARDLWWEARNKTAALQQPWWVKLLAWITRLIFGTPVDFMGFGAAGRLMCVDLNKYRPDVNVEMLIDMGVRVFMLRVGGPASWVWPANPVMDETFVPYYNRIRTYAKAKNLTVYIIGYGVHNAWSNEQGNYIGLDPQVAWLKEATRNHLCDDYCWDDEVAKIWKDGKETTVTANNLVKSISICMEQTFNEMERSPLGPNYHKMPVHYSANWFMKTYAPNQYLTWLDNNNKDIDSRHFLTWRAWIPTVFSEVFATIGAMFDKVIDPTGIQENAYLRYGSGLAADFWQCTFTAKGNWCGSQSASGIDASVGYGPSKTLADFAYCANLPLSQDDTPKPPDNPNDPPQTGELEDRVEILESTVAGLDAELDRIVAIFEQI